MKKTSLIITLLLLATGWTWAQDRLVPDNINKFENTAKKVNQDDYKNMVTWATAVFRQYSEENAVDFTMKAWQDTLKAKATLEKNYKTLLADKEKADQKIASLEAKNKLDADETKKHKRAVDSLASIIKSKDKTIENLQKSNASVAEKDRQISANDSIISVRDNRIKELEKLVSGNGATLDKLIQDTTNLRRRIQELNGDLASERTAKGGLQKQLVEKDGEIKALNDSLAKAKKEKQDLEASIAQYQKAFDGTKTTINNIYTANKDKPLAEMDKAQLSEAESAWDGMKALMEVMEAADPKPAKELREKVDEIRQWETAIEPLRGAIQYMKGKYDNKQRQSWIAQLKKLKLSGSKNDEIQGIIKALEDQEMIKALYTTIIDEKLAPELVIPDSEVLRRIKGEYEKTKQSEKRFYHPNCYDSYDAAIKKIENELNQKEPSNNVNDSDRFKLFIQELREMF